MRRLAPTWILALVLCGLGVSAAQAQPAISPRPFQPLFGGIAPPPATPQHLIFDVTLAEAYDDDIFSELRPGLELLSPRTSGYYAMLVVGTDYAKRSPRTQFAASVSSALRYYNDLQQVRSVAHSAGLGFSAGLARYTTLTLNQSAAYSPSFLYSLFPSAAEPGLGEGAPPAPDYASVDYESMSYSGNLRLARTTSHRGSVSATAEYRYLDYLHWNEQRRDAATYGAGAEWARGVTRYSLLRAGYHFRRADFTYANAGGQTMEHALEAGVNYARSLSPNQAVDVTLSLGPAIIDYPSMANDPAIEGRHFKATGEAALRYTLGPWSTSAVYTRGVEYLAELTQPVLMQGASLSLDALLTSRLDVSLSGRYATGQSAMNRNGLNLDTYSANARVRYALGRNLAGYVEYLYYFYDFRRGTQLPSGIPGALERNGVRAGLSLWLPALQR